ncbi:MAG: DNA/RNA non-specific endonuclease [Flavobacteriales bacterium AspAUS03]
MSSAERTISEDVNVLTFLMTNIILQAPRNNLITYPLLEDYMRGLVRNGKEVYVVMSLYVSCGLGSEG